MFTCEILLEGGGLLFDDFGATFTYIALAIASCRNLCASLSEGKCNIVGQFRNPFHFALSVYLHRAITH
jgi:hypothetical protein